ncbi:hypothetical protein Tco_0399683 [Tanacetum coccineum]
MRVFVRAYRLVNGDLRKKELLDLLSAIIYGHTLTPKVFGLEQSCRMLEDNDANLRWDMHDLGVTLLSCIAPDTEFIELKSEDKDRLISRKLAKLFTTYPKAYDITLSIAPELDGHAVKECREHNLSGITRDTNGSGSIWFYKDKLWRHRISKDWYNARDRSTLLNDVFGPLKMIRDTNGHLLKLDEPNWDAAASKPP